MARLLVVHHTPSPALHTMLDAVLDGTRAEGITGVDVEASPALVTAALPVLEADGYILGTPVNLGTMSGALKHFFDTVYYPCLGPTAKRPVGVYLHGNNDGSGAERDITKILNALEWQLVAPVLMLTGQPQRTEREQCWELGATVAAHVMERTG